MTARRRIQDAPAATPTCSLSDLAAPTPIAWRARPAARRRIIWVSCAFVAHRRRRARPGSRWLAIGQVLGLTAVLTAALAVTSCTSAPGGTGSHGTTGRSAVTPALARQVWDHYAAVIRTQVIKAGLPVPALSLETGPRHAYDAANDSSELAYPADSALAFYLPAHSGYPHFFVVDVTKKPASGYSAGAAAPVSVDGAEVRPLGPELLLFEQVRAGQPWLLASTVNLAVGETLPKLATDGAGYVQTVAPSAAALLARPDEVGAFQAAVVDDGPASPATRAVADGQLTTGLYRGALGRADGLKAPPGDIYQWELTGTSYPEFALRTAGGGALVFYTMALDTTIAVPGYIDKADPVRSGPPIQVPVSVRRLLPVGQAAPLIHLQTEQLLSFAAIDPPPVAGKIRVIAIGGGLTSATAS